MGNKRTRVPPKTSACDIDDATPLGEVLDSESGDASYGASYSKNLNYLSSIKKKHKGKGSLVRKNVKDAAAAMEIAVAIKIEPQDEHIVSEAELKDNKRGGRKSTNTNAEIVDCGDSDS